MKKNIHIYGVALLVFILFFLISYMTPLAGDDWGYAINGAKQNPFLTAFEFYFSWSGRYFSELLGFVLTNHKWLWNILNASIFTSIFILINKTINDKQNKLLSVLTLLFLMLSVHDFLRMETYTWIMGTANYTIALLIIVAEVYLVRKIIFEDRNDKLFYFLIPLNFIGTLMVENASVIILLLNIAVYVYGQCIDQRKKQFGYYLVALLVSIVGFSILRLSPGAAYRTLEHTEFFSLNVFEMIGINWNNFLTYTYLNNKYLMMVYTAVAIVFTITKLKDEKYKCALISTMFFVGFIQSISSFINSILNIDALRIFYDLNYSGAYIFVSILLIGIIVSSFYIFMKLNKQNKILAISCLILAGIGMGAMLISPIIGARNSLFTVYLLFIIVLILLSELSIYKVIKILGIISLIIMNLFFINRYLEKYKLVYHINIERMAEVEYYKNNPEIEEAWIVRMPIYSIHSPDVEEWDTYHMEVFKEYFGLNPDVKLIFYYKDEY